MEKRYRNLFDSISDLIMIHDLEGRLLNVNPAVSRLSGYAFEELEDFIRKHSEAEFSHGVCPDCARKLYPDLEIYG